MTNLLLALTLTAISMAAADATGKWVGTLNLQGGDDAQSRPAYLVLKQEGAKLTGTAGPDAGEQHAIEDGKAEDGRKRHRPCCGQSHH
jgi:hypothetical protein